MSTIIIKVNLKIRRGCEGKMPQNKIGKQVDVQGAVIVGYEREEVKPYN
ncbi:hypothetical protein [Chryseobacterium artocarpi]